MLDVLHFVFSSFWTWLGTLILLGAAAAVLGNLVSLMRGK